MPQTIVDVSLSLQTTSVSRAGFGTPAFLGSHRWFTERMRTYSTILEAEADFPSGSDERAAATAVFSQTPSVTEFKVGRREATAVLTPDLPLEGGVFSFTLTDNIGYSANISFTALAAPDEEDIVDGLIAAIALETDFDNTVTATKVGVGASAVLHLDPETAGTADAFSIKTFVKLTDSYNSSEAAGDLLTAVEAVDNDFYVVTAHDHSEAFVLAMAAAVQARNKQYFTSSQEAGPLVALAVPAVDTLGKLEEFNYLHTNGFYHNTADTTFPECAFAGKGLPYTPGTITWAFKQLAGVATPISVTTGLALSSTEQDALEERNANYLRNEGGVNITWQGTVASGNFIDEVRIIHFLTARIKEAYQLKLINSLKVSYTDIGIGEMQGVLTSLLTRFIETPAQPNILRADNPYTTSFPRAVDVSTQDKIDRKLTASFEAFLAGAIHIVAITGSLSLDV